VLFFTKNELLKVCFFVVSLSETARKIDILTGGRSMKNHISAAPTQHQHSTNTAPIQHQHSTNTAPVQHQHSTNTAPIQL